MLPSTRGTIITILATSSSPAASSGFCLCSQLHYFTRGTCCRQAYRFTVPSCEASRNSEYSYGCLLPRVISPSSLEAMSCQLSYVPSATWHVAMGLATLWTRSAETNVTLLRAALCALSDGCQKIAGASPDLGKVPHCRRGHLHFP